MKINRRNQANTTKVSGAATERFQKLDTCNHRIYEEIMLNRRFRLIERRINRQDDASSADELILQHYLADPTGLQITNTTKLHSYSSIEDTINLITSYSLHHIRSDKMYHGKTPANPKFIVVLAPDIKVSARVKNQGIQVTAAVPLILAKRIRKNLDGLMNRATSRCGKKVNITIEVFDAGMDGSQ